MTTPLWILAIGSICCAWIGLPKLWMGSENSWERWFEPVLYRSEGAAAATERVAEGAAHHSSSMEWMAMRSASPWP